MASSLYRRQSMAQLYEKLRAQDDDDDLAWLAQYSPDDKSDDQYVSAPPPTLSTISSSPVSSISSGSSMSDHASDSESSDGYFGLDSDSDVDPEPLELDLACTDSDPSPPLPLIFQFNDVSAVTEPSDPPEVPFIEERSPPLRSSPPLVEPDASPVRSPSISYYPTTRATRTLSARRPSPAGIDEDGYAESDGDASEDEYIPSPAFGARKRRRSARFAPSTNVSLSQKRGAESGPCKRPHHFPQPRNVQAAPGMTLSAATKNNQWACPYCKWVQRNHRTPDLKRHIRTHTRLQRPAQWVCCGVSVKDAENYNLPENVEPYIWGSEEMIGGCRKEFSRRDALKRHLDNEHIRCIGNFAAFASICEDEN